MENFTDVKIWSVEDIINSLKDNPSKKEKITIPKFQRTLVWKEKQRKLLINSIKNGMPIGAILLYKVGDNKGITEYQLIDGLQRVTTLKEYSEKPTDFYDENNLHDDFIEVIRSFFIDKGIKLTGEEFKKYLVYWIRSINGFEESNGFSSSKLARFLDKKVKEKLGIELSKDERDSLEDEIMPYLRVIKNESDISTFEIPVIIYTGEKSNLPTIFERINSKGTQLSKYQIFAATWSAYKPIKIKNEKIIGKIKAKYEALIDEGLEVENYDPSNFYVSKFTYFEYLFGLGKLLSEEYPLLFKSSTSEHEADSIGFNLVAICIHHNLKELEKLPESLKNIDHESLEEKIFEAVKFVNDVCKPYIGLKANKKTGNAFPVVHTEFQIVSLIGKVFRSKYKINSEKNRIENNERWKEIKNRLFENIPYHYLYDIIKGFWSGTGDRKAMERAESDWYENPISRSSWESALLEWNENEKNKKEKNRATINKVSILFLKYIYAGLLSAREELSTVEFEVDHVIPFARLKKIANQVEGLPISAIGNLALIRKNLNRDKRDKTFYEYYDELLKEGKITEAQKEVKIKDIEKYTFTTYNMLEFIDDLSVDKFYDYLDKRFEEMRKKFYELNKIY